MGDDGGTMQKSAMATLALTACATTTACASTATTAWGAMTETTKPTSPRTSSLGESGPMVITDLSAKSKAKVELSVTPALQRATFAVVDGALLWSSRRMRKVSPEWQPWTCFDGALVVDGAVVQSGRPEVNIQYVTSVTGAQLEWVFIGWRIEAPGVAALRSATSTTPVTTRFCQHEYVIENLQAVQALLTANDPQLGL